MGHTQPSTLNKNIQHERAMYELRAEADIGDILGLALPVCKLPPRSVVVVVAGTNVRSAAVVRVWWSSQDISVCLEAHLDDEGLAGSSTATLGRGKGDDDETAVRAARCCRVCGSDGDQWGCE